MLRSRENQQDRTQALFHYSMLNYPSGRACLEHSNFLTVNVPTPPAHRSKGQAGPSEEGGRASDRPRGGPARRPSNPTTSFLTATTLIYAIGAGITAAAGTRLALQLFIGALFGGASFRLTDSQSPPSVLIVTTSPGRDWVICAPAAFLGCGSRFSGSLSGIEP